MAYLAIVLAICLPLVPEPHPCGSEPARRGREPRHRRRGRHQRDRATSTWPPASARGISGLGGLYYTMDYIKGTWANDGTIEALGWLALALVIFAVLAAV